MAVSLRPNVYFYTTLGLQLCIVLGAIPMLSYKVKYFENTEYPFILFVSQKNSDSFQDFLCTGALISKRHLIVPAQCIKNKAVEDLQVTRGSEEHLFSQSVTYDVSSTITYKNWASNFTDKFVILSDHDIAIIKTKEKVKGIIPASISIRNDSIQAGYEVNAIGWLEYRHPNAREFIRRPEEVSMVMLNSTECIRESTNIIEIINSLLMDETLCAETKSRGPLVTARDQIGPVLDSDESLLGIITQHYETSSHREVELILRLDDFTDFISKVTNNSISYTY
ncbi:hypothetical protein QAD02_010325 [Eretmocerus hayati]|uniref:Uncharacterized protein n=1 Tax=Eretmocerus hayati TaxID=131215 RepID=A0ACC2NC72_9HYME|nr:hypothetical protein QAD02_010325 [Eretmocerus hayati]